MKFIGILEIKGCKDAHKKERRQGKAKQDFDLWNIVDQSLPSEFNSPPSFHLRETNGVIMGMGVRCFKLPYYR